VAIPGECWLGGAFVANDAARATTGERKFHVAFLPYFLQVARKLREATSLLEQCYQCCEGCDIRRQDGALVVFCAATVDRGAVRIEAAGFLKETQALDARVVSKIVMFHGDAVSRAVMALLRSAILQKHLLSRADACRPRSAIPV
jgi:hypothetical protein